MNHYYFLKPARTLASIFICALVSVEVPAQQVIVSSRNSNSVRMYEYSSGNFIRSTVSAGSGGLSLPQEVLLHPDGFLLVTGRGNTAIKKYDIDSGEYLGNFTNGYTLDNPTKTTIHNGLLYVSQWGIAHNKVVRFNLQSGAFIDEFTSIGVPNGGGHAWDAAENLYVAQYGDGSNGRILKFDPTGDLIGTFINSNILEGPINLWFDTLGHLMVVDWTLGDVLQFNAVTGDYETILISGTSNLEGFTFDEMGNLLICDWSANKVYRFDFNTLDIDPFIDDSGLLAPNSVLIRPSTSSIDNVRSDIFHLIASPSPTSSEINIVFNLRSATEIQLDIVNTSGQVVSTLFSGMSAPGPYRYSWDGASANGSAVPAGIYIVRLTGGEYITTTQIMRQ